MTRTDLVAWTAAAIVLAGLAIPWFLWGTSTVVAGLPVWLWWHVGWLCLAAAAFRLFANRAWGIGIETSPEPVESASRGTATDEGGERR